MKVAHRDLRQNFFFFLRSHLEKSAERLGKQSDAHINEKLVPDTGVRTREEVMNSSRVDNFKSKAHRICLCVERGV